MAAEIRTCPVCRISLREEAMRDLRVDRCSRCQGIFFDKGELEAILRIVRLYQAITLNEPDIDTMADALTNEAKRKCPGCGVSMEKQDIAGLIKDVCPDCGGIWLDGGEIVALKLAERHIMQNIRLYLKLGN